MEHEQGESPTRRSFLLSLSQAEWQEFLEYARRYHEGVSQFFTRKALELIADGRERSGRKPN